MKCPYCFNLFIKEKPNTKKTRELLNKCKDLNIKVVSFGGGDPFIYDETIDILDFAYLLGFEIHVDTNCQFLTKDKLDKLDSRISLLGIPLDGSNAIIHNLMRTNPGNYELIIEKLELLRSYHIPIKINTVVSRINSFDILNIKNILTNYKIKIWSLYQFWPLNVSDETQRLYQISDTDFAKVCNTNLLLDDYFIIEINPYKMRYQTSLFTSPNGLLYIHDPTNIKKYSFIGSIFENDLQSLLIKNNIITTIRREVKVRYYSFNCEKT